MEMGCARSEQLLDYSLIAFAENLALPQTDCDPATTHRSSSPVCLLGSITQITNLVGCKSRALNAIIGSEPGRRRWHKKKRNRDDY
jgi:hypothetical protein